MAVKQSKATSVAHTAGIFADMTLDGPEIGTLVAVVDRAKNLPNRRTMGKQDPYCAMRLGKEAKKTDTDRRGGQTPKWDQELRFTVHESPDYYRLKISVFNDDKKTDLIGEAFVNLADLIKPGGGSNDLWHQLNYKGKYAGEIRIEMTYYDLRPREEKPAEKKRQRGQTTVSSSDAPSTVSGPRQLGPREVKRRPLPASPGITATTTPPIPTNPSAEPPQIPPKTPLPQPDIMPEASWQGQYIMKDRDYNHSAAHAPMEYDDQQAYSQQYRNDMQTGQDWTSSNNVHCQPQTESFRTSAHSSRSLPICPQQQDTQEGFAETWEESGRRHSEQLTLQQSADTYESAPHVPHASHSAPEVPQLRSFPGNVSPVKALQYRDSPLRHSMSQHEVPYEIYDEPESFDDPPPPPPRHRDSGIHKPHPMHPPSSFVSQPSRPTPRRPSIDERSPLQTLEYGSKPVMSSSAVQVPHRHSSYDVFGQHPSNTTEIPLRHESYDGYPHSSPLGPHQHSRRTSLDQKNFATARSEYNADHRQSLYNVPYQAESHTREYQINIDSDPVRQSTQYDEARQADHGPPSRRTSDLYDTHQPFDNMQAESVAYQSPISVRHQPISAANQRNSALIRPTPQKINTSQSAGQILPRKAISPSPYPDMSDNSIRGTPFGPDSYDVLNPASSPVTNEQTQYETPEQALASARIREIARARSHDPIIGDDGRVIDPADHLPSDTWAPEPEKKQRKPEHVIHVRTRNDLRTPGSSPNGVRMMPKSTPQGTPLSSPSSLPPSGGRNTLQRTNPNRPLPVQPYGPARQADQISPVQTPPKRHSYHAVSPGVERPPLSEYQVPVANSYSPRGLDHQISYNYHQTPSKQAYAEDYFPGLHNDPLAAEMSMIDIGPSRSSRTALRSSRGY